jgi:hypothetical protein
MEKKFTLACFKCQKEFEKEWKRIPDRSYCDDCWNEAIKEKFCLICQKSGVHLH